MQEQANKLFASISEANTVLSDPVRRKEVWPPEVSRLTNSPPSSTAALQSRKASRTCRVVVHMVCAWR